MKNFEILIISTFNYNLTYNFKTKIFSSKMDNIDMKDMSLADIIKKEKE
jgi:hypothetical protein